MEQLRLHVEDKVLNPLFEERKKSKLRIESIDQNGETDEIAMRDARIEVHTTNASGNVEAAKIVGDEVVALEGGIATIKATVSREGSELSSTTDIVVAPFYREYHQTLVLKLYLGVDGEPVDEIVGEPRFQKKLDVICTFEEALDVIRRTDNLTRGIPKIIYLVGWQKGGNDHHYPSWDDVNPKLKRDEDDTAVDTLRWLIREARRYNTTVSLHINMTDAFKHSPLWDEYVDAGCIARDESGVPLVLATAIKGEPIHDVVYPVEWNAGLAQRRIDRLIQMLPELEEGHTIHIDVFIAQREDGSPISPWHAKPENGGLMPDRYVEIQRKIFHYWRERGFDVTGEGIFWAHPPGEGFTGLQPMSWWYPEDLDYQIKIPEYLMARGRTHRDGEGDFRFGSSMHGEEIWIEDKDSMPDFLGMFCRTTLPWYFLSRAERLSFDGETLHYSNGIVAHTEDGHSIIRKGDFILRDNDDLFVPALWNPKEIIAYSRNGYIGKSWILPDDWVGVTSVDVFNITPDGCVPSEKNVPVREGGITLTLAGDEAVSIQHGE